MSDELTTTVDSASTDATAGASETTDTTTQTDAQQGTDGAKDSAGNQDDSKDSSGTAKEPSLEELQAVIAKQNRDIARHINTIKTFQAKEAPKTADKADGATPKAKGDADTGEHPALKGLTPDDDGEYEINGKYYTRDEVIDRYEDKQTIQELKSRLDARDAQEQDRELKTSQAELKGSIKSSISQLTTEFLPNVPADRVETVNRNIFRAVEDHLETALDGGKEFTEELLHQSITAAFQEQRSLYSAWAVAQLEDNSNFKTNNPIKPGQPGSQAPVDPLSANLNKNERSSYIARAVAATEKALRGG